MALAPTSAARVRICATSGGTFANLAYTTQASFEEGVENDGRDLYLGGEINHPGDPTVTGSLDTYYDPADATGQEVAKTAKRNGTTVFLQICPAGTATGAKVEQCEVYITGLNLDITRTNRWVGRGLSYRGIASTLQTITLV